MAEVKAKKPGARSPGRPRDMNREKTILEVTLGLLAEVGFSGLTVDAVVARAKVSKATIYRRWSTKEELAVAAFDQLPLVEITDTGDLEENILSYIDQYGDFLRTTPLRSVLPGLVSEAMHNKALAEQLQETVERRRASGIEMFREAITRGDLPMTTDPILAHELIIGPMLHRSFFFPDNFCREDFSTIAKVIIAGLKAVSPPISS